MSEQPFIYDYIILPFVLIVFKRDRRAFTDFKFNYLYERMFDHLIELVQKDLIANKQFIYQNKMEIKLLERSEYIYKYKIRQHCHERIIEFSRQELKELTEKYIRDYFFKKGVLPSNQSQR
ncbi:hypothetical protein [Amphibacillus sediminis]|uniref:hypothetical protein n=1 Tax=Amphibacillus sediminis TaxID=360185 RepID=UPI00082A8EA8|nr:hypothetical protein [Amphibacillus sediminis]